MFTKSELEEAIGTVRKIMNPSPLYRWPLLHKRTGCHVWVKHENHTPTGAFKVRGGIVLLEQRLRENPNLNGVITATRGNHGQSISFAGKRLGIPVTVVVPKGNSQDQNRSIEAHGAELIEHGDNFEEARQYSKKLQTERDLLGIDAFERELVLGVASYAYEMMTAKADLDTIYVPVGMGSGICALIQTRDLLNLKTKIVGVVSEGAPAWLNSFKSGKVSPYMDVKTIADGIATSCPPEEAFELVKNGAEKIISVSEDEIRAH